MIFTNGNWKLAPAYDLLNVFIILQDDTEELALTLGGKKKKLIKEYFDIFGQNLGLNKKQVEGVYRRFVNKKPVAFNWIEESFLSEEMKRKYMELMEKRYIQINV